MIKVNVQVGERLFRLRDRARSGKLDTFRQFSLDVGVHLFILFVRDVFPGAELSPQLEDRVPLAPGIPLLLGHVERRITHIVAQEAIRLGFDKGGASACPGAVHGFLDRPIERRGLEPDVEVRQNAKDLAAGRDTVLAAASQYLMR